VEAVNACEGAAKMLVKVFYEGAGEGACEDAAKWWKL
jgi:hypothetical protein